MTHGNRARAERLFNGLRRAGQTQQIGDMTAAFANGLGKLGLRIGELIDKPLISLSFFNRIEVSALHILDQADFQRGDIIDRLNNYRHLMQARHLCRAPASFTGDNLIAVINRAHQKRLQDAGFLN